MTASEACHLVLQTISLKSKKSIFILNIESINILTLAKILLKLRQSLIQIINLITRL